MSSGQIAAGEATRRVIVALEEAIARAPVDAEEFLGCLAQHDIRCRPFLLKNRGNNGLCGMSYGCAGYRVTSRQMGRGYSLQNIISRGLVISEGDYTRLCDLVTSNHDIPSLPPALPIIHYQRPPTDWNEQSTREWLATNPDVNRVLGPHRRPPLSRAARQGMVNSVRLLLKHGAEIHLKDSWGKCPLHAAVKSGSSDTVVAIITAIRVSETHSRAGINTRDRYGRSPLHDAMSSGFPDIVALLCAAGANPELCDRHGRSPLAAARKYASENIEEYVLLSEQRKAASATLMHIFNSTNEGGAA